MRKFTFSLFVLFIMIFVGCLFGDIADVTAAKTTIPITIDGEETMTSFDTNEWNGAKIIKFPLVNPTTEIKIKAIRNTTTDEEELYFLIKVTDNTENNTDDKVRLFFDILHNHGISTDDDRGFEITRGGQVSRLTGDAHGPTIDATWSPLTSQFSILSTSGNWLIEMKIKASQPDLNVSYLPSLFGFSVYTKDQPSSSTGFPQETFWPHLADPSDDPFDPTNWANFKTRYPIEYMIVLDQSGSMLSQDKWTNAKISANILANTLAILKSNYFDDKLGVVTFSWINPSTDNTDIQKPLSIIPDFPVIPNYIQDPPVQAPLSNYYTPIGSGLNKAFGELGAGIEESQRVILLLSDGLHNRPQSEVPLIQDYLVYNPCDTIANWTSCPEDPTVTDHQIQVNTIALGEDWGVDTALLTNIKNRFSGAFGAEYQITTIEGLKEKFINSLQDLFHVNEIPIPANGQFCVDPNNKKLIVILSWMDPTNSEDIDLQISNDGGSTWNDVSGTVSAKENLEVGHSICFVNNPQAGKYRIVQSGTNNPISADSRFALVDLHLSARFTIDRKVHGTGQEIVLRAILKEAGAPIIHDPNNHPVKVTVNIKRPGEGFGTYVSLRTLDDCEPKPPELPPIDPVEDLIHRSTSLATLDTSISHLVNADVKPERFAKIDALFKLCEKDSLIFIEDPGIELYDDGTHGDVTPNDGIYTLRFLNTEYEGSYVFRFKVIGISPSGIAFSRMKTFAEYVRIEVDPDESEFGSRKYQQSGNIIIREFYIIPRDSFGGYLGPGYPDQINFESSAGNFIGSINDSNNGIYSQLLRYDESKDRPVVTAIVQGKQFKPIKVFKAFELVLPFAGRFFLDSSLGFKDGNVYGARLEYRFTNQLTFELEGGITFTEDTVGEKGNIIQAMANLRYDILPLRIRRWAPYVTAGAGYVFARGFGTDDEAFAFQSGVGSTYRISNSFGARIDAKIFRINKLFGSGNTTNYQVTGGLVFWF